MTPICSRCRRVFRNEAFFEVIGGMVHFECLTPKEAYTLGYKNALECEVNNGERDLTDEIVDQEPPF